MTSAVLKSAPNATPVADRALGAVARVWWVAAARGQAMFLVYIVAMRGLVRPFRPRNRQTLRDILP